MENKTLASSCTCVLTYLSPAPTFSKVFHYDFKMLFFPKNVDNYFPLKALV